VFNQMETIMTIELDELDKEWLSRPHSADEYRHAIKNALERCAMYSVKVDRLEAELTELRKQKEKGTLDFYRPWRSVHDYPPPFDTPVLVAVSLLGRGDFVFAAGVMYRKPNGVYADGQGNAVACTYRPEFWLSLDGLKGLQSHGKEVKP